MDVIFDHHITDVGLQEQIRVELKRVCPEIMKLEFGPQLRVKLSSPVDRRKIEEAIGRIRYLHRTIAKDLFYASPYVPACREDPFPHLAQSRQVVEIAVGQYLLQGEFLALMQALDGLVVALARTLGAKEQDYPAFVPVDLLKRINYFHEFPHHVMVVASLCGDHDVMASFATRHEYPKHEFTALDLNDDLGPVVLVAPPSVCYTCYYALRERRLDDNLLVTAKNRCARNEPTGFRPLTRLNSFTMREIIVLGQRDFVLAMRQRMLEALRDLTDRLQLAATLESAHDPFFTNDAAYKASFQHSLKLKYEWRVAIPHSDDVLAVASVNLHNDAFGKAFEVTLPDGSPMQSACIGFGLERWAYAILCQFGWDRSQWPDFLNRHPL